MTLQSICVFCGSSPGTSPEFMRVAEKLGHFLAKKQITLVYGGASCGLMGLLADSALSAGGKVIGVIPEGLFERELVHLGLTELFPVQSMHERKALMMQKSDAFIAMPGGIGTLEELFEVWTWAQLGIHKKPIGLLNTEGFFNHLLQFLDSMVTNGFLKKPSREYIQVDEQVPLLIENLDKVNPLALI